MKSEVSDRQSNQLCDQMPRWAKACFDAIRYFQSSGSNKRLSGAFLAKHFGVHISTAKRWLKWLRENGFLLESADERFKDRFGRWKQRAKIRIVRVLSQNEIARRILAKLKKSPSQKPMSRKTSPVTNSNYKYTLEDVVFMLKNVLEVDPIALQTAVFHLKKPS